MELSAQKLIYFSPTQTTQKVLTAIAEGTGIGSTAHLDLTAPAAEGNGVTEINRELALIGVPVYGGRVALDAVNRLQQIKGNQTPAIIIVVVYGNREFEDALVELRDIATAAGFVPVAAGAFIGEHSFASETMPIANGRPDSDDLEKARTFGQTVRKKLDQLQTLNAEVLLQVPGNTTYKERMPRNGISPVTTEETCTLCGTCTDVCPTAAIAVGETVETDKERCIICCACVKNCPSGARIMADPNIQKVADWLHTNFSKYKNPELFS
ncbi:MAG: 4Fe-4S binding protein [Deltaproteobacteria bacterium]|nr:4Fe-4S binding protein [Deltaproteobacteria bacterium]